MKLYYFDNITTEHSHLGGKGYTLGLLKNAGFNVPDGLILTEPPTSDNEWNEILKWWEENKKANLAIRSSAIGEDSKEQSFAGQNSTYLNINTENNIRSSITNCFQSMYKASSSIYRDHFLKNKKNEAKMNVVLQVMVDPYVSGVFFSVDPRNNDAGWIVEAIEGLGEDLVSGKKNPWHFEENKNSHTNIFNIKELVTTGLSIRDFLGTEIDMEWAIDHNRELKILQARPVTALSGKSGKKRLIDDEIKRLKATYPDDTLWDGGTFAEWNGPPSELTFSLWKEAFSKSNAFSKALKKLGYLGIDDELPNESHSLLERIFNMAYVNISMLAPLYFGPVPYRLELKKTPTLKFDFHKMNAKTFLLTPFTMFRMLSVAMGLSTRRHSWLNECNKELVKFSAKSFRVVDSTYYQNYTDEDLLLSFKNESEIFYNQTLVWPLTLITLIESTTQNLKGLLKGVLSEDEINKKLNQWMSQGIHTVTADMNNEYREASLTPSRRKYFLQKYGHRGPGELELSHPRWIELGDKAFVNINSQVSPIKEKISIHDDFENLKTYKKQVIEKEWNLLSEMLELREKWKMQLLSPYSHLRFMALEIAKRHNLEDTIFWMSYSEILNRDFNIERANKRKNDFELSKSIYLPAIIELSKLENFLGNSNESNAASTMGIPLSPGAVYGEVRIVINPDNVNTLDWPDNTILVAESTDPGWTGLFLKSKAIVVEKGGVLSHCAIVAREMNLPAISGIKQCHLRFKDGDKIWVDGNNGRVTLA